MSIREPYVSVISEAFNTAINILAVEYLVKTTNEKEYGEWSEKLYALNDDELDLLYFKLSFNMHTANLGAMITQGDYDYQREILLEFLNREDKFSLD